MNFELLEVVGITAAVSVLLWIALTLERIASLLKERAQ
jgi:hypothetical protein